MLAAKGETLLRLQNVGSLLISNLNYSTLSTIALKYDSSSSTS